MNRTAMRMELVERERELRAIVRFMEKKPSAVWDTERRAAAEAARKAKIERDRLVEILELGDPDDVTA